MLDGLFVLELASVLAGPSVGQFFAELGATVVKVENPRTRGDVTRRWRLPGEVDGTENGAVGSDDDDHADHATGDDRSAYFCCCNYGKQSLALDLSTDDGQAILHDLAGSADVVLSSFRPGRAASLGADAETLRGVNPALLVGQISGYGADDDRAGYDAVIQAESGFTYMNGSPDGPPTKMPVALVDVLAAHQLKEGLLVGLLRRTRTGVGGVVHVSLMQAAVSALANQATNWLVGGHVPQRMGSAHPNIAPYGTPYATADAASIVLAVGTDRQFASLCRVLGLNDLPGNPHFTTNAARVAHRDVLDTVLRARIGQMESGPLLEALRNRHVPAGRVRTLPQVFATPPADAMTLRPEDGPAGLRQVAFDVDGATSEPASGSSLRPPPRYAEHTASVLQERLSCSPDRVDALASDGVIDVRSA